tara:strand:+ start:189 stop:2204 length:2016 start_codon:yes stop_codon:yes gene_type:complete
MTYSGSSPNNSNNSDTTIPPERQQYVDTTGDGEIDTLILGTVVPDDPIEDNSNNRTVSTTTNETQPVEKEVTPPPDKLNAQQVETFTKLIKTNPDNPKWQKAIKDVKFNYSEQLGVVSPSISDRLTLNEFEDYSTQTNFFQKATDIKVDPLSITTGTTVLTASKQMKSFAVTTEASLTNFLSAATKIDSALFDLPGEIKSTASLIAAGAQTFVGQMGNVLTDALVSGIQGGLAVIATKIFSAIPGFKRALRVVTRAQTALVNPVAGVFKGMNCLVSKVVGSLQGVVEDMLTAFVKNALNAPACAIQQFIGAVLTKVNSMIDNIVTPLTGGISKVLGPVFKVKDILSSGINLADKIGDFFTCGVKSEESDEDSGSNVFKIDKKSSKKPKKEKEQQNILDKATKAANTASEGISNFGKNIKSGTEEKITNFEKEYGQWTIFGSKVSEAAEQNIGSDCYTGNVFKCGAPTAEIFGGDGVGASGKVILGKFIDKLDPDDLYGEIKRTASIIGVEITNPGDGYTEAPLIDFSDNCNQGYGAYGEVIIEKNVNSPKYGQVTNVIITSEGEDYPVDLPAEVGDIFIKEIIVEDGGEGYENAFIDDKCMNLKTVDGKIVGVEITCQNPYRSIPIIDIINPGIGAVLRPIMSSTPQDLNQNPTIINSVDCVGDFPKSGER